MGDICKLGRLERFLIYFAIACVIAAYALITIFMGYKFFEFLGV